MKNTHVSSVITGSSKPEQVVENIKALAVVPKLTTAIMERIDEILKNRPEQYKDWLQDAKAVQREVIAMKKAQAAEEAANVNKEEKAEDK
jgi:diketogulonate reductase-like aldo/keto reductase